MQVQIDPNVQPYPPVGMPLNRRRPGIFGAKPTGVMQQNAEPQRPQGLNAAPGLGDMNGAQPPAAPMQQGPLGGSMREPFDYEKAMAVLNPPKPERDTFLKIADVAAPILMGMAGNQAGANAAIARQHERRRSENQRQSEVAKQLVEWRYKDWERQNEADLRAADPFTIGRDRVQYDPGTGTANVVYDGAEDFELYADKLGLEPGSDDYFTAVEDYILRGSGPSAHGRDMDMDDHRTSNDEGLERLRYGNRVNLENLRQQNRGRSEDQRQGNRVTLRQTPTAGRRASPRRDSVPVVRTPAEARRLPSGTRFKTPTGQYKVAP